jgi:ethanolamine utilization protein EutN
MQIGRVLGRAISTVKHPSFKGWKLLVVQPVHENRTPDGEPVVAVDGVGAGSADLVLLSSDGAGGRTLVKDRKSPVRWTVIGICDPKRG